MRLNLHTYAKNVARPPKITINAQDSRNPLYLNVFTRIAGQNQAKLSPSRGYEP